MYPASTTSSTPRSSSQVAITRSRSSRESWQSSANVAVGMPAAGPLERARVLPVRRHRPDRQPGVDQRLEVRPLAADEHADHSIRPITRRPAASGTTAQYADPEVEDPPQLVLRHVPGQPLEHRRALPRVPVDHAAAPSGHHAREVALDSASRHVGERAHVRVAAQRRARPPDRGASARADRRRRSPRPRAPAGRARTRSRARRPTRSRRRDRRPRPATRRSAPRGRRGRRSIAGEVELLFAVDARQLRRLAADQRAPGGAAHLRGALDQLRDLLEVEPVRGDVVEQEERIGPGRRDVVDAVRGEVRAAVPQRAAARGRRPASSRRIQSTPPADGRSRAGTGPRTRRIPAPRSIPRPRAGGRRRRRPPPARPQPPRSSPLPRV